MSIVDLDSSPSPIDKSLSPDDFEQQKAASNAEIEKVTVKNSHPQMTEILTIPGVVAREPVLSVYMDKAALFQPPVRITFEAHFWQEGDYLKLWNHF